MSGERREWHRPPGTVADGVECCSLSEVRQATTRANSWFSSVYFGNRIAKIKQYNEGLAQKV